MNRRLLLVGGGGHCKSVLDVLLRNNEYSEIAIVDIPENIGDSIFNIPIIGCDNDLDNLYKEGFDSAFITLGSIGNPKRRIELFKIISEIGFNIPNVIDESASISERVTTGRGVFIGRNTIINCESFLGNGVIINNGAIIEHDCYIGDFVHISPGAVLCGGVKIQNNAHVGAGTVIRQNLEVGESSIIGIGSVVTKNIEHSVLAYGNPCIWRKSI